MLKLLLCLACTFGIAITAMQLRQQELELKYRAAKLQADIEGQQAKLWSQQLQIAIYTAPASMPKTLAQHDLELVPEMKAITEPGHLASTGSEAERDAGGL
ncbi:MAG: hypothetical protein ACM359_01150 [Bacillota bacterium]